MGSPPYFKMQKDCFEQKKIRAAGIGLQHGIMGHILPLFKASWQVF